VTVSPDTWLPLWESYLADHPPPASVADAMIAYLEENAEPGLDKWVAIWTLMFGPRTRAACEMALQQVLELQPLEV
jgi:hypothetical protein